MKQKGGIREGSRIYALPSRREAYFGGKKSLAPSVWKHFGVVRNFVEPFAGSLAVLLERPRPFEGTETVNDLDGFVSNFWRALAADADAVARHADWPVSELDLHARHLWLVNEGRAHVARLREEPDYFDAKIAGWWCWGACLWIGAGWCEHPEWKQLPHLGDAGRGVRRPSHQLPHLNAGTGDTRPGVVGDLRGYLGGLSKRLRRVRVCCGDWSRVCGPTPTTKQGLTAVFLDPPYGRVGRDANVYATESDCAPAVRAWCHANGRNKQLRIALCGYAGEGHESLESDGWRCVEWKARGGYGSQGDGRGRDNATRERMWVSPHCVVDRTLFDDELAESAAEDE